MPVNNAVEPVNIRDAPNALAFETRCQIRYSVCECVAMLSAACVHMS
jgi:hypothetical protein